MLREMLLAAATVHPEMDGLSVASSQSGDKGFSVASTQEGNRGNSAAAVEGDRGSSAAAVEGDRESSAAAVEGDRGSSGAAVEGGKYRALYGVDVMLDSQFQPKLLEVTYCPDCTRAVTYDMESVEDSPSTLERNGTTGDSGRRILKAKDFWNDVFGCLFLNEEHNVVRL